MNYEDVILSESSRRDIYRCLSKCFQLPENGLNEILPELDRRFAVLDSQSWPSSSLLKNSFKNSEDLKDLQLDFAKLFVGPYSLLAPPYGSVYIDRQHRIMGDSTIDAIKYYDEAGLEVASRFKEAPDHIVTELEFMYFLIHEELRAVEIGDTQCFYDTLDFQREFLTHHLNCWVESFAQKIKSNATTCFYVALGEALNIFVSEDANYLINLQIPQGVDA